MRDRANLIHTKALDIVARYRRCEVELIDILQQADSARVCYELGYNSLFKYCVDGLGLSEEVAYVFINVARKATEVPALKEEIRAGRITVSKAKKISAVINENNQQHWLRLASSVSKKQLEKEVATANPLLAVQEKAKYVQATRLHLQLGVSEELMNKIERIQNLVSQKMGKVATYEDAVEAMANLYIEKLDPIEKAKRSVGRDNDANLNSPVPGPVNEGGAAKAGGSDDTLPKGPSSRSHISAKTRHYLTLQTNGRCSFVDASGRRCAETRFLHIHHKKPISEGGDNDLSNLELLCSGHHKVRHT